MGIAKQFRSEIEKALDGRPVTVAAKRIGLPRNAIRQILMGHIPKLDRAAYIAQALGLEIYIGPPREDDLSRALRRHRERAMSPERELLDVVSALRQSIDALKAAQEARKPDGVPVEIKRALELPDDCTLQDVLKEIDEWRDALAARFKLDEPLDDLDEQQPARGALRLVRSKKATGG